MHNYEQWLKEVREKLAAAAIDAGPLIDEGRFDEAELIIRRVNSDIYGAVKLGELYTGALERCMRNPRPDRVHAVALYDRALRWRSAWPGVHTAEEAAAEARHIEEVRQELTRLLESA